MTSTFIEMSKKKSSLFFKHTQSVMSNFFGEAAAVLTGVHLKNSAKALNWEPIWEKAGAAFFIGGWSSIAYDLWKQNKHSVALSTLAIMASAMSMRQYMDNNEMPPIYLPIVFASSWLYFGYNAANPHIGLASAIAVLISMMWMLPKQRELGLVDGAGFTLFALAWVGIWLSYLQPNPNGLLNINLNEPWIS